MRSYFVALLVLSGFLYPCGFIQGETYKGNVETSAKVAIIPPAPSATNHVLSLSKDSFHHLRLLTSFLSRSPDPERSEGEGEAKNLGFGRDSSPPSVAQNDVRRDPCHPERSEGSHRLAQNDVPDVLQRSHVILAGQEITKKIRASSSEVFYGGIYVGCSSVRYDDADIIVSVTEPGKPEMKRKMRAGDSMDIGYKNKDYKLTLRNINFFEQDITVSVIRMRD